MDKKSETALAMQLLAFCEQWQPFRVSGWNVDSLARTMGWPTSLLLEVLHGGLETDFPTFCAVFRISFVERMRQESVTDLSEILQMAGFDSVEDYEISRKILVFSKGFV